MKRRGFTLVELMVVLVIIALLMSILFPTFTEARESARKATCSANLRQLGLAFRLYAADYDSLYPDHRRDLQDCSYHRGGLLAPDWSRPGSKNWAQAIFPYVRSHRVLVCPSNKGGVFAGSVPPISYVMNGFAAGRLEDAASNSSNACLLWDTRFVSTDARLNPAPNWMCWFWGWTAHELSYNVLFQDGHVKSVPETSFGLQIWSAPEGNMFYY
jgi:prepilin-type N-terminal cleavage/methylation domain-containing protein/prepilin-type processing-associated H-X9-DG protein